MENRKCPYCSKRISYVSAYASRRKAEYVCERCGKESRVVINRKVIPAFVLAAVIAVAIMAGWIFAGLADNPLGILLVAVPLIIFTVISPKFVKLVPLKKYKKSMEARKAGIEYSDNLVTAELEENEGYTFGASADTGSGFKINSDVFNTIKAERNAAREKLMDDELISDSSEIKKPAESSESYVPVIKDVSEKHSSDDIPLKKIHSDNSVNMTRTRHYIPSQEEKEPKKPDGNRYSANRKF
ncbi:hypothetical protein [Ruminococcus sp.]|jgi:DNA-directed RNA polymerase subunit RPC12/RpoP|uniref:hypothetical protein n=1 Tax=Ruminococcus sp. TaxID=41978 RepID=UPI002624B5AE|nr:hypothetical protein [Ruminococcus sp.]MCI2112390.1 hypothetical protein [Ruminococcus sp.]MDD6988178.1 hypothetical protein [Ruminococcus sp.]MDY6201037.1 hypothetical protein [Ruminococcus sp.]